MRKNHTVPDLSADGLLGLKEQRIVSDTLGSYTGLPANPYETPVQDADDL